MLALLIAVWAKPGIFSLALSLAVLPSSAAFALTAPVAFCTGGLPAARWLRFFIWS